MCAPLLQVHLDQRTGTVGPTNVFTDSPSSRKSITCKAMGELPGDTQQLLMKLALCVTAPTPFMVQSSQTLKTSVCVVADFLQHLPASNYAPGISVVLQHMI